MIEGSQNDKWKNVVQSIMVITGRADCYTFVYIWMHSIHNHSAIYRIYSRMVVYWILYIWNVASLCERYNCLMTNQMFSHHESHLQDHKGYKHSKHHEHNLYLSYILPDKSNNPNHSKALVESTFLVTCIKLTVGAWALHILQTPIG